MGCPIKLTEAYSIYDGIFTYVFVDGVTLETFSKDKTDGIYLRVRTTGGMFSLARLSVKTKVKTALIRDVLFANEFALFAHLKADLHNLMTDFAKAISDLGLTISVAKKEIMFQNFHF